MAGDITPYTDHITSEHNKLPKFMAVISALVQPLADITKTIQSLPALYDLDTAVGDQLDTVGLWIGISRVLTVAIPNVYFSFDDASVGFDLGTWKQPNDPTSGQVVLADDAYRRLLRARIADNHWDGTIPGAYAVLADVFPGNTYFIQDYGDMTMTIVVIDTVPLDAVTQALLTGGYLNVKPAGVHINGYATPSTPGTPIFGFDAQNSTVSGFDTGSFATIMGTS